MAADLAAHQRAVLALILQQQVAPEPTDAYAGTVAGSPALALVRDIAASWRPSPFGRSCPLTWRALVVRGGLDPVVHRLMRPAGVSPYLAPRALAFLDICVTA